MSTTDLVGRMLLMTKTHFDASPEVAALELPSEVAKPKPVCFSSRMLYLFSDGTMPNKETQIPNWAIRYGSDGFCLYQVRILN